MQDQVSNIIAFTAGLFSFFSPCTLPLIPVFLSMHAGTPSEEGGAGEIKVLDFRFLARGIAFVAGFSIIFVALGLSATMIGRALLKYQEILLKVSGIVIILFGLHTTGIIKIKSLYRERRASIKGAGIIGSFLMGTAFSMGWTPCIGPILSTILIYAGLQDTVLRGFMLLVFYSLGLGIPFLLIALFAGAIIPRIRGIYRYLPAIQAISGVFLVVVGVLVYTGLFNRITQLLS